MALHTLYNAMLMIVVPYCCLSYRTLMLVEVLMCEGHTRINTDTGVMVVS